MLACLTLIFACQLAGELSAKALGLPVPGPVIGMLLLFVYLAVRGGISTDMGKISDGLLRHLALLFVPAGVGVILHFRLIGADWAPIGVGVVVSTVLAILVTGWLMARLNRGDAERPTDD